MKSIVVSADINNLDRVVEFVTEALEGSECPVRIRRQIEISVEEVFVNIAKYAYPPKEGDATITYEVTAEGVIRIAFTDKGMPYDPLAKPDPDITASAKDRPIGGLGVYITKKSMDKMWYEYVDGQNILTMEKSIRG